jgi:hypothetical protein
MALREQGLASEDDGRKEKPVPARRRTGFFSWTSRAETLARHFPHKRGKLSRVARARIPYQNDEANFEAVRCCCLCDSRISGLSKTRNFIFLG